MELRKVSTPPTQEDIEWAIECLRTFEQDLEKPLTDADKKLVDDEFLDEAEGMLESLQMKE